MPANLNALSTEVCGRWMPKAQTHCGRTKGHGNRCYTPELVERRKAKGRVEHHGTPDLLPHLTRAQHLELSRRRGVQVRKMLAGIKVRLGCADCGYNAHAVALDFDHVRGKKIRDISQMVLFPLATIQAEIAKCEVVCANCHRVRTADRLRRD